jgi:UDP-2,3-diacylglucosamine pyrophosphatase LpxH
VIRRLLTMSKRGTEVIYVTGNHDEFLRRYSKLILGNIQLVDEAVHVTADGRHLLVIHGDQFDVITRYHRWLAFLGDSAYEFTLTLNRWLNHWRARYGYGYWSLSAYLKHKVKTAVSFISDFEEAIAHECVKRELHGVVCGHIHHAEIRKVGEVDYLNCGDWVESCTALIEHWDGTIELYRLADAQAREAQLKAAKVAEPPGTLADCSEPARERLATICRFRCERRVPCGLSGGQFFHRRLVDRVLRLRKQPFHHRLEEAQRQRVIRWIKRRRIVLGTELDGRLVLRVLANCSRRCRSMPR